MCRERSMSRLPADARLTARKRSVFWIRSDALAEVVVFRVYEVPILACIHGDGSDGDTRGSTLR
jgi:hypothetical protein